MKILSKPCLLMLLGFMVMLQSCVKDNCERTITYTVFNPVYKTEAELHAEIVLEAAQALEKPGKIYYYDPYILVNERREGIHVIDNSNPEAPQNVAFIKIPGNIDMAVKGNTLYADHNLDVIAIDISDINNISVLHRTQDVFPDFGEHPTLGKIVYYEEEVITEVVDCSSNFRIGGEFMANTLDNAVVLSASSSESAPTGIGGSMARFTITGDHLYAIDQWRLHVFDISNLQAPSQLNTIDVVWNIETIFPYEDKLFIGARNGMHIFDNQTPSQPVYLSTFGHWEACDPVFVKGNDAYVTLRSGNACEGFTNQLDVIDITNLTNPTLRRSFPMDNPHGLSIVENSLFLCEGAFGLKVFDITDPMEIDNNLLQHIKGMNAFDVIALPNNVLLMIGQDGLYQYNYADPQNLNLLSKIDVE